jgi:hypothetical protein
VYLRALCGEFLRSNFTTEVRRGRFFRGSLGNSSELSSIGTSVRIFPRGVCLYGAYILAGQLVNGAIQQPQASVGILVGLRDESRRPAVLLQVRAAHDSYAGACQVTTHGKLTDAEMALDEPFALGTALGRKLREEIGDAAAAVIEAALGQAVELERVVNTKGRLVVTQGIDLAIDSSEFQALIVPGRDVGGFRTCSDPAALLPLEDSHKTSGVPPGETRMFADEITAVKRFFERIFGVAG